MDAVAQQFTDYYYNTFDTNRAGLTGLYRDHSMLSFEGQQTQGAAAITEKLVGLPMQNVAHKVETRDAQPGGSDGTSIVVLVTGMLQVDGGANALKFSQCFTLNPEGGSYYVFNDLFRLNYG